MKTGKRAKAMVKVNVRKVSEEGNIESERVCLQ